MADEQGKKMINVVVALRAEARPLIERYGLVRVDEAAPYRVYRSSETQLIVSGVGKTAAAAATGYLHALGGSSRDCCWVNAGVAGCHDLPCGQAVLAREVCEVASGARWQLAAAPEPPFPTAVVATVDEPVSPAQMAALNASWAFEMEAAGFYPTAHRFAPRERIHCFKVISDNAERPAERLSAQAVTRLIARQLESIDVLLRVCGAPLR